MASLKHVTAVVVVCHPLDLWGCTWVVYKVKVPAGSSRAVDNYAPASRLVINGTTVDGHGAGLVSYE